MKPTSILFAVVATVAILCGIRPARAQADIPADYLSIIGDTAGTASEVSGSPGSIPVHGKASFPVLIDANNVPVLAAGRYGNGVSATAARAVAAAHTAFFNTSGTNTTSRVFLNSVLWASRKSTPATITVGSTNSTIRTFFSTRGYLTKAITTNMPNSTNDLTGVDVFVGNFHDGFNANAITKIQAHAANGGGVVLCSTPWALSAQPFADAQSVLEPFGLSISGSGVSGSAFTVAAAAYPAFHGALNGLAALVADVSGGPAMTLAQKKIAAGSVDRVMAERPGFPDLLAGMQTLEDSGYGLVQATTAVPLVKADKPVEAMLARFQSGKFDTMTAAQLIAHPSAPDWPGSPAAGGTVSKSIAVDGNVPVDFYMNQGNRGRRVETRLYAAPGATLTVTIPADKVAAGIALDIGCHIDENFNLSQWRRFPKITRRVPLTQTVTQTGNVFGGLVWINIPEGASLGDFNVSIDGALEAPCFQLGVDTDATWNATLKNMPGAWGCIMTDNVPGFGNTPGFTVYAPRAALQAVTSAEAVALHWKKVLATADDCLGYTAFRKRGESALCDRELFAGSGHAGYPVMMNYGTGDVLVKGVLKGGEWGFYHEIGHTFQDNFDSSTSIATHGEVDVNLVPALVYNLIYDKTCWDGNIHSTFNGANRLAKRAAFLAMPPEERTWLFACNDGATGYDFFFSLAEAFGWEAYGTARSRLMAWNQGAADAALAPYAGTTAQVRRDRFYIIFCDATGRNLDAYFQSYGLGVPGLGYEISQSAKNHIAAKGYPVWNGNTPVDSISDPGPLAAAENAAPGTVLANLTAIDPEEPGTMWTWTITSGNTDGRLVIDKRTGELKVGAGGLDHEQTASYTLGIQVEDGGVPRYSATRTITLNVNNVVEPPMPGTSTVLNAMSAMSSGTVLGPGIIADASRSFTSTSILSGNGFGAFAIDANGQIVLQNPAALPSASLLTLVVSGTDSAGATGSATIRVLANATPGLREQRWSGTTNFNNNTWTGATNYTGNLSSATTGQNVANSYSRRLLGWLIPPVTGEYTFWISSDDSSRFYLGTDETEVSKSLLCSLNGSTGFQNFDGNGSQMSDPVTLEAGKAYWFEAQQSEVSGSDHVSVAWQGAGIPTRGIVAGAYLIPNQAGIVMPVEGNGVWINAAGGSWPTPGNWAGEAVAGGTGKTADFGTLNLLADATVTLDGPRTIGNLAFGDTTPSHNWIVNSGSGGPLTLDLATGVPAIAVNNGTTTLNVVLAGDKGLAKTGAGTLTLSGANTFSGGMTISHSGSTGSGVVAAHAEALGTGPVLVNGGQNFNGSLAVNSGLTVANALTLKRGGGGSNRAVLDLGSGSTWSGGINVDNTSGSGLAAILARGNNAANASIVSGDIGYSVLGIPAAGSPTLVLRQSSGFGKVTGSISLSTGYLQTLDSCNWEFSNPSNTWGTLDISNAGAIVTVGLPNTLPPGGVVASTVGGTLRLNNQAGTTARDQSIAGLSGNVNVGLTTGAATLTVNTTANQSCSGVIAGAVSLVKNGAAVQTLAGLNTYTGNTTVNEGTLALADNARLTFSIGATSGTNNSISGAGTVTLEGDFDIDTSLADASALTSGTWTLENVASLTGAYGDNFQVVSGATVWDVTGDVWTKSVGSKNYSFDEATGVLTMTGSGSGGVGFDSWAASKGLTGPDAAFDADPDNDGLDNGLEFVLGGEPNPATPGSNSAALLPTVSQSSGNLTFTFKRKDISEAGVSLKFQWSTDLTFPSPANDVPIGAVSSTTDTITVDVTEDFPDAETDTVVITIPAAKAAGGKLFGRLSAVKVP